MEQKIQIISFRQIDSGKWNECVFGAPQGTVFAAYEYLTAMAGNWYGLVVGDYEAVLPLLTKTKWRIRYLRVIPFVRQLGLIGSYKGSAESLLTTIQGFCKYGDIAFNEDNGWLLDCKVTNRYNDKGGDGEHVEGKSDKNNPKKWARPNYVIDLRQGYEVIRLGYRKSLRKRLRQTTAAGLYLVEKVTSKASGETPDQKTEFISCVLQAYQDFIRSKMPLGDYHFDNDFTQLEALLQTEFGQQYFHAYTVEGPSGDTLLLGLYALDDHTIFNMMSVCVGKGLEKNAMAFAVDALIQKYAGRDFCFDFMGSSLPGVQEFINGFGATLTPYFLYHYNHLPFPLKMLKK